MSKRSFSAALWALAVTGSACSLPGGAGEKTAELDYLADFPTGEAQRIRVCGRGHEDRFADLLCPGGGAEPPEIRGLADLQAALWIAPGETPFAITAQSTSSVARSTTVLNPRVVFFPDSGSSEPYVILGFARGDGFAEVAALDPVTGNPNFYFIRYRRACDPHCDFADRFTPDSENGWEEISVYDHVDLRNTPLDCLMCHQPGGTDALQFLRMQEIEDPWTHWFQRGTASEPLLDTFLAAHGGEPYAGIPASSIEQSNPGSLQFLMLYTGNNVQPNAYPGGIIESEGRGPAWLALFQAAIAGEQISPPHWSVSPFDPEKVADAALVYGQVRAGTRPARDTPDLTDLFADASYPDLGFTAATEAQTGADVVRHRCGTCHNGLVPEISRNNFDVHDYPDALSATMRERVLDRIRRPATDPLRMPPVIFSELREEHLQMIEADLNAP